MAMELRRTKAGVLALPTEVEEDILVRLPVKDLVRSREVCKPWKSLIDSISFKKKHLHFAQKNLSTLLLCRCIVLTRRPGDAVCKPTLHLLFPDTHLLSPSLDYEFIVDPTFIDEANPVKLHPDDLPMVDKFRVANGLVLLRWNKFLVVWNPLSNKFRKIDPPPYFKYPDDCKRFSAGCYTFGFDPKTHDYKIVFAYFHGDMPSTDVKCKVTFQLYSLRNESWKIVSVRFNHVHGLVAGDGYMDGKFYWFAKDCGEKDGFDCPGIVSFDFTDEIFEAITLPKGLIIDKEWDPRRDEVIVVTTRGCLELIKSFQEGKRCEIWGMGQDGSWTRKMEVSLPLGVGIPRGISKDGQLVCGSLSRDYLTGLLVKKHFNFGSDENLDVNFSSNEFLDDNVNEILLINPNNGACKNLGHGSFGFEVFTYVESLFSIIN